MTLLPQVYRSKTRHQPPASITADTRDRVSKLARALSQRDRAGTNGRAITDAMIINAPASTYK